MYGFEVDLAWAEGKLTRAVIRSKLGGNLRLRTAAPVTITGAQPKPANGPNPNPFFATVAAGPVEIANPTPLPVLPSHPTTTVDFPTTPGATYTLTPAP